MPTGFDAAELIRPGLQWLLPVAAAIAVLGWTASSLWHRSRSGALARENADLRRQAWSLQSTATGQRHSQDAARESLRFLAGLSHELRTPAAGICGLAEILQTTALDPEQRTYVEAISTSGLALAGLVDEILDISRIDAGKMEIRAEQFDLVGCLEGVSELLAPMAHAKGIEIATLIRPGVPEHVVGDVNRLRQVLVNLAGNAVKFTQKGGVEIGRAHV